MANENPQNYWQPPEEEQPATQPVVAEQPAPVASEAAQPVPADTMPDSAPVTWTAQEYVHLDRSPMWFILFALVVLALVALDIFLFKSWTFSALVIVMAIALIIYIRRPPRSLTYSLSPSQGLYIGERLYHFDEFKAFGLIADDGHYSIMMIPRKRFSPGVSVFFPDEAGERIVDILGQRLPMENLKLDLVDVIVRKLRL